MSDNRGRDGGFRSAGSKTNYKQNSGEKKTYGEKKSFGEKKTYGEKKNFGDKKPFGEKKSFGDQWSKMLSRRLLKQGFMRSRKS